MSRKIISLNSALFSLLYVTWIPICIHNHSTLIVFQDPSFSLRSIYLTYVLIYSDLFLIDSDSRTMMTLTRHVISLKFYVQMPRLILTAFAKSTKKTKLCKNCHRIGKPPQMQLILPYKISWIRGGFPIPFLSLTVTWYMSVMSSPGLGHATGIPDPRACVRYPHSIERSPLVINRMYDNNGWQWQDTRDVEVTHQILFIFGHARA